MTTNTKKPQAQAKWNEADTEQLRSALRALQRTVEMGETVLRTDPDFAAIFIAQGIQATRGALSRLAKKAA